ncbi:N-acetylmuramoyl-L-alanine amidase [Orenia metallireducens]|jgi:N-acetylmuramoyl-L-alanine amidase|uniref:N-acetylmuramoyl-L-alanine amidase n=1 Tax=Orenia metallireducens TaxID=1413210 RepID=A0A285GPM6_9FIRM|nr:cell wall hydrolase [Orenia metallireducens]PRX29891.1 N-acetylmuramoyl-L-alanine amidase [Orenia metallireducens]SNY25519.1 N-acetylmuramoyl-L-alanine amidase [Orenia metallireducens]
MERKSRVFSIIAFTLVFLLIMPCLASLFAPFSYQAYAAEVSREDAYKGLAFTVVLIYLFNKLFDDDQTTGRSSWGKSREPMSYTDDELTWLARAVHAEARGEPFEGQVAVASVVLNRVQSNKFPNTIYSVIHQKKQFSSVDDGQIYLPPNESSYKAAKEAFRGSDPTDGALYFYNPITANPVGRAWLETREKTIQIGSHVFAR